MSTKCKVAKKTEKTSGKQQKIKIKIFIGISAIISSHFVVLNACNNIRIKQCALCKHNKEINKQIKLKLKKK